MNHAASSYRLVVSDYDEAIAFYVDKLGFILVEDTVLSETKRWVLVKTTWFNNRIAVGQSSK